MIGRNIAHYKIVEKLGAGGMGEVYRANDTKLGRDVALKVLPPNLAGDPERRKRFEREARAIATLKHPNIVTIYSVEEADGQPFITLELIEGATVSSLLARGGLTLDQFFNIAIPLADAISTAHEQNVTHRDLKPTNVMIEKNGTLKVLDFGLAKLLDPREDAEKAKTVVGTKSDTAVGQILGTAAYMSPEQAEGKPIDGRSDIFSLGIVYYEMASGERPFKGETHISTISSILKDHPPHLSEVNHLVPRHLGRIVEHCLEKDPEKRFQTAKDVRNELQQLKREVDSGHLGAEASQVSMPPSESGQPLTPRSGITSGGITPPPGSAVVPPGQTTPPPGAAITPPGPVTPPPSVTPPSAVGAGNHSTPSAPGARLARRTPRGWLLGAIVVVAAIVAVVYLMNRPTGERATSGSTTVTPTSAVAEPDARKTAVVLPFENLGPAEDAYFAAGVSQEITSRLAAASGLRVISRTSAAQYDRTGKTMKQIGEDLGAEFVLNGTVRWARSADGSGRVRITPELIRVADDTQIWTAIYDREVDDIFKVQTEIAGEVIGELGVNLHGSERELMSDQPTTSLEAYQLYLQALNVPPSVNYDTDIVELLEKATELDPEFMAAWYRLARHHSDQYRFFDRTEERLERARTAIARAEAVDPNNYMVHLARGYYYYYGFRDYDRALEEFTDAAGILPNDSEATAAMAYIYRRKGDLDKTVELLRAARELDPKNAEYASNLGGTYRALRRFDEAKVQCEEAISISPDDSDHYWGLASCYLMGDGDLAGARKVLGRYEPKGDRTWYDFALFWWALRAREFDLAVEYIQRWGEDNAFTRAGREALAGEAMYYAGNPDAAAHVERGNEMYEEIIAESPSNSEVRQWLALGYAILGRDEEAIREAKTAVDLTAKDAFSGPSSVENLAAIYTIVGRHDEAIDLLERLLSKNYSEAITVPVLKLDPIWDPLRENPRFQKLVNPGGA